MASGFIRSDLLTGQKAHFSPPDSSPAGSEKARQQKRERTEPVNIHPSELKRVGGSRRKFPPQREIGTPTCRFRWGACPATPSRVARDGVAAFDLWGFGAASSRSTPPMWREVLAFSRNEAVQIFTSPVEYNDGVHVWGTLCTPSLYPNCVPQTTNTARGFLIPCPVEPLHGE